MSTPTPVPPSVEVMWRPGCPSCRSLRRGLSRAGVVTTEHDIFSSTHAAARVRSATGGDETVPTVFVGDQALVNPSVGQVVDAIGTVGPGAPMAPESTARRGAGDPRRWKTLGAGGGWTLLVAVVWTVLAVVRPTTTWHLAPLVLGSAWPWVVGQDTASQGRPARRAILLAGGAGLGAALAVTGVLAAAGRLAGPTWTGPGSAPAEALLLSVVGAALATAAGLLRTARRTTHATTHLGTYRLATSDDVVVVEGNSYFPLGSVPQGVLQRSSTSSICPWKGVASYYDVLAGEHVVVDGAWTYRHPSPLARRIKDRVAFCQGIEVVHSAPGPDSEDVPGSGGTDRHEELR